MPPILIVDDEPALLAALETALTRDGHRVRTTSDPEQALQLLDLEHPHLVLLDIKLPGTNGLDLLRRMREGRPQVAVIVVSGDVDDRTHQAALDAGARDCLQKPVSLQTLKERVARAVMPPHATGVVP
jgi:DNA-binding response OmpR family regulator